MERFESSGDVKKRLEDSEEVKCYIRKELERWRGQI